MVDRAVGACCHAALGPLVGRKDVAQASPPVPTRAIAGVQADLATVKQGLSR